MQRLVCLAGMLVLGLGALAQELGPPPPQQNVQPGAVGGAAAPPGAAPPPAGAAPADEAQPADETGNAPVITLLDALEEALVSHPDLGASREAIRRARGQRQSANGALLPSFNFGYTEIFQRENQVALAGGGPPVTVQPGNVRTFTLSSDWVLFAGGALRANQAIARMTQAAAEFSLQATVNGVVNAVVQSYLQLLRAQELTGVADRAVELAVEQVNVARLSFDAGTVPRVNVLRAEAALQNALQGQLRARNGVELARAQLLNAMGRSQLEPVRIAPLPRQVAEPPGLLDSLQRAVRQRPELRAQASVIRINEAAVDAARAGWFPTLALGSQVSRTMGQGAFGNDDNYQFALSFSLPLWDWGVTAGRVQAAQADVRAERQRLERTMQNIELAVRQSILSIDEARQRVGAAEAEVVAAREALTIEQVRYTAGEGTYLEFLDARRAFTEAESNLVTAYYDNALAEAAWLGATGSYVASDAAIALPQGQTAPYPPTFQNTGATFEDLQRRYGLDPLPAGVPAPPPAAPPTSAPAPAAAPAAERGE